MGKLILVFPKKEVTFLSEPFVVLDRDLLCHSFRALADKAGLSTDDVVGRRA